MAVVQLFVKDAIAARRKKAQENEAEKKPE